MHTWRVLVNELIHVMHQFVQIDVFFWNKYTSQFSYVIAV